MITPVRQKPPAPRFRRPGSARKPSNPIACKRPTSRDIMANVPSTNSAEGSLAPESVAPSVSVIIPHYNDLANLERCMRLLAAQSLPLSQFEIVVADNNSRCGPEDVERGVGGLAP